MPFGIFRRAGSREPFRGGVAIGSQILDLAAVWHRGALDGEAHDAAEACCGPDLNAFCARGPRAWRALRLALSRGLREGSEQRDALEHCLVLQAQAEPALPVHAGDYTDFYASIYHATAVGMLLRPDNPLLPNYKWVPIAYHGRASSLGVGASFPRPSGQVFPPGAERPEVVPSRRLDYELELGIFIGTENRQGSAIGVGEAEQHIFGCGLLNDWSARDVQAWEYQPLGPFLAKNFATTLSPWVVTLDALEPFRVPWTRAEGDPQPLPYLDAPEVRARGGIDIRMNVSLETARMRADRAAPALLGRTSFKYAYWTIAQMLAHHTVNGCNLQPGDLFGSGTMSGPASDESGSLLELTRGGKAPVTLPNGETRTFLEDGDRVVMRAWCEAPGAVRIGFGECSATVEPAHA